MKQRYLETWNKRLKKEARESFKPTFAFSSAGAKQKDVTRVSVAKPRGGSGSVFHCRTASHAGSNDLAVEEANMTDENEDIPEKHLQRWFVLAAKENDIVRHIRNRFELICGSHLAWRDSMSSIEKEGLAKASRICEVLQDATFFSADQSISPPGFSAAKPDVVLFTSTAHPVIIELKTKDEAERQGVQELLAYSAALKMQSPFLNDFLYIIVAGEWTTLLELSVRALILEGKHVLPLKWVREDDGFHFKVRTDLFKFELTEPYAPMQAMVPELLVLSKPTPLQKEAHEAKIRSYFVDMFAALLYDCNRLHQSGFVAVYSTPRGFGWTTWNLVLATVDQNWLWHRGLNDSTCFEPDSQAKGFRKLANKKFSEMLGPNYGMDDSKILEDALAFEKAVQTVRPASSLSSDLVVHRRDIARETACLNVARQVSPHAEFDEVGFADLSQFVNSLSPEDYLSLDIRHFRPFGDLKDFTRANSIAYPTNCAELVSLLEDFNEFKSPAPRAVKMQGVTVEELRIYKG